MALTIALAQLNPTVGDIDGNLAKIRRARDEAAAAHADLVVLSELAVVGYPPEDLVLRPSVIDKCHAAVDSLIRESHSGPALIVTTPWREGGAVYNAAVVIDKGETTVRFKSDLPNYGVFDEKRIFSAGPIPEPVNFRGNRIGVPICEDIWTPALTAHLARAGAQLLLVPNGSPYETGKFSTRLELVKARARETNLPVVYVNQVGGQDELVFDGGSFVLNADHRLAVQLPSWEEAIVVTRWRRNGVGWVCEPGAVADAEEMNASLYAAMVLGLRDYVNKNRFPGVVLGLSGGIDSALSAAVAADALGPARVRCVMMPSRFTAKESLDDAAEIARLLGLAYDVVPIEEPMRVFGDVLKPVFAGRAPDTTEENIQARIRGMILMAISNKFGPMVLTTGNKSEMSVGYATLYGDMAGGYSVLKDLYKTQVFALARWRNQQRPHGALGPKGRIMPENVIVRPPTAELRANQKDEDSLPPYAVLDGILECLIEGEMSFEETLKRGFEPATVKRVEQLLYSAEYKRRQAPPGVKLSTRNFGRDRRYPITNAFRDAR